MWPQLPEKKWMKHNKKEYRESVSVCGRFELNEWYYWFVQEKKFYEVTSEFERRLCEKETVLNCIHLNESNCTYGQRI